MLYVVILFADQTMPELLWFLTLLIGGTLCKGQLLVLESLGKSDLNKLLMDSSWPISFNSRRMLIRKGQIKHHEMQRPNSMLEKSYYTRDSYRKIAYNGQQNIDGSLGDIIYLISNRDLQRKLSKKKTFEDNNKENGRKTHTIKRERIFVTRPTLLSTNHGKNGNDFKSYYRKFIPEMLLRHSHRQLKYTGSRPLYSQQKAGYRYPSLSKHNKRNFFTAATYLEYPQYPEDYSHGKYRHHSRLKFPFATNNPYYY